MKPLATVAIVGSPNVGKSTLFNALAGKRKAIVSHISGTTRDRLIERISGEKYSFWLVDTAGLTNPKGDSLENKVQAQASIALEHADLILFVTDGRAPLTSDDYEIVEKFRKSSRSGPKAVPMIFIANKIDDANESRTWNLAKLGLGMPLVISAKNFVNIQKLQYLIEEELKKLGFSPSKVDPANRDILKLALIGRPNVGKSTLFNALLKKERAVVSEVPGTTRDTIDTELVDKEGQKFLLLDTAGLRRKGRIERDLEFWSTVRSGRAIERADVCALLIDAVEGVTHQDLAIAGRILEAGKGLILCINKFDLIPDDSPDPEVQKPPGLKSRQEDYLNHLSRKIKFLPWAPVLFMSAETGKGVREILKSAVGITAERQKRIPTAKLNQFVSEAFHGHVTPSVRTKRGKFKYATQADTCPPKFIFFVNNTAAFHFTYRRYLENKLREKFGFYGTPIIIEMRDAMGERKK